jgi:hypothetical protein
MPRFIRAGCETDGTRHERETSAQKLLHSNPRRAPWLVRECDPPWIALSGAHATRLRAGPFDTGRTRSGVELDGAELQQHFRAIVAFAQQLARRVAVDGAG